MHGHSQHYQGCQDCGADQVCSHQPGPKQAGSAAREARSEGLQLLAHPTIEASRCRASIHIVIKLRSLLPICLLLGFHKSCQIQQLELKLQGQDLSFMTVIFAVAVCSSLHCWGVLALLYNTTCVLLNHPTLLSRHRMNKVNPSCGCCRTWHQSWMCAGVECMEQKSEKTSLRFSLVMASHLIPSRSCRAADRT